MESQIVFSCAFSNDSLNTYDVGGTVETLMRISFICSPLMVVESQKSVISFQLYIISPTCKSLNAPSSYTK